MAASTAGRAEVQTSPGTRRRVGSSAGARARAALSALPLAQREALLLATVGGLSESEIAGVTQSSVATTRGCIHSAMQTVTRATRSSGRPSTPGPQRG